MSKLPLLLTLSTAAVLRLAVIDVVEMMNSAEKRDPWKTDVVIVEVSL